MRRHSSIASIQGNAEHYNDRIYASNAPSVFTTLVSTICPAHVSFNICHSINSTRLHSKQDVPVVLGNKHARETGVPCPTVHLAHQWRTLLQNKQTTMFHTLLASGRSMLPCTQSYLIEMLPKTCYNFVVLCKTCLE